MLSMLAATTYSCTGPCMGVGFHICNRCPWSGTWSVTPRSERRGFRVRGIAYLVVVSYSATCQCGAKMCGAVDGSTHVYHRVATHREHAGLEPTFKVHARARPPLGSPTAAVRAPKLLSRRPRRPVVLHRPRYSARLFPTLIHARRYSIWTQREPGPIGTEERVNGLGFSLALRVRPRGPVGAV